MVIFQWPLLKSNFPLPKNGKPLEFLYDWMYIFHVTRLLKLSAHYCLLFGTFRGLPHRQMPTWLEWIWPAWPAPRCLPGTISRVPWYIFRWLVCLGPLHALVGKPVHCCASCLSHDPCHPPANAQLHQRWERSQRYLRFVITLWQYSQKHPAMKSCSFVFI